KALKAVTESLGTKEEALSYLEDQRLQELNALKKIEARITKAASAAKPSEERLAINKKAHLEALATFRTFLEDEKQFGLRAISLDDLLWKSHLVSGNSICFIF